MPLGYQYLRLNEQQKVMNGRNLSNLAMPVHPADAVLYSALMHLLVMSLELDRQTKSRFVVGSSWLERQML